MDDKQDQKFLDRMKYKLYYALHHILKYKNMPPGIAVALVIIHHIQITWLTYNNNEEWAKYNSESFNDIIELVLVFPYVKKFGTHHLFLGVFMISFGIMVGTVSCLIIFMKSRHVNKNGVLQTFAKVTAFIFEVIRKLFFMPMIGIFLQTFDCNVSRFDVCFGPNHIIISVIAAFSVVIYSGFQFFLEIYFFTFSFKTRDSFAKAPSTINVISLLFELISVMMVVLIFTDQYNLLFGIFQTICGGLLLNNYFTKLPFFNESVLKAYIIGAASFTWSNIALLLVEITGLDLLKQSIFVMNIVGIFFFGLTMTNTTTKSMKALLTQESDDIKSDILLDAKARLLYNLAKLGQRDSKSELFLASLMRIHANKCQHPPCPCKNRRDLYDPKKYTFSSGKKILHKDLIFIKHFILSNLKGGVLKFLGSRLMSLDLIYFLFESLRNYPQSYVQLSLFNKREGMNQSSIISFIIFRLEFEMKEYLNSKNQEKGPSKINFEDVMRFDRELGKLKDEIINVTNDFIDVWEIIDSQLPDLQILSKSSLKTLQDIEKTQKMYEKVEVINNHSLELKVLMEIYCSYVTFNELLLNKISDDIEIKSSMNLGHSQNIDISKIHENWDIFDEKSCTIEISTNYDKMGQIVDFSTNAPLLLGYDATDLKLQNLNALLPKVLSKPHQTALKYYFDTGFQSIIGKTRKVFVLHKEGYVFSALLVVKSIPNGGAFRILALIHKLEDSKYILTDFKGEIDSMCKELSTMIGITPANIHKYRLNVQFIAPKTVQFFKDFYKPEKKRTIVQQELKGCSFIIYIPNSLEKVNQRFNDETAEIKWDQFDVWAQGGEMDPKTARDLEIKLLAYKESFARKLMQHIQLYEKRKLEKCIKIKGAIQQISFFRHAMPIYAIRIDSFIQKDGDYLTGEVRERQERFTKELERSITKINKKIKDVQDNNYEEDNIDHAEPTATKVDLPEVTESKGKMKLKKWLPLLIKKNGDEFIDKLKKTKTGDTKTDLDGDGGGGGGSRNFYDDWKKGVKFASLINQVIRKKRIDSGQKDPEEQKNLIKKKTLEEKQQLAQQVAEQQISQIGRTAAKKKTVELRADENNNSISQFLRTKLKKKLSLIRERIISNRSAPSVSSLDTRGKTTDYDDSSDQATVITNRDDHSNNHASINSKKDLRKLVRKRAATFIKKGNQKQAAQQVEHDQQSQGSSINSNISLTKVAKYLQESLESQQTPMTLQISYAVLYFLILGLVVSTLVLEFQTRTESTGIFNNLNALVLPSSYGYLLLMNFDAYLSFRLISENKLDLNVYDTDWYDRTKAFISEYNTELKNELFAQTQESKTTELFIFNSHVFNMRFPTDTSFILTMDKFISLVVNAVNKTQNYNSTSMDDLADDYLYLLNSNIETVIDFIDIQLEEMNSITSDNFDSLHSEVVAMLVLNTSVLILAFLLIFPVIFRARLAIEKILVLFTKISKADSEYYLQHYKILRIKWNAHGNDIFRLQRDLGENLKLDGKDKRVRQGSSISRSKLYKSLKSQQFAFLLGAVVFLSIVIMIICIRTITHMNTVDKMKAHGMFFSTFSSFKYEFSKNYILYRYILSELISGTNVKSDLKSYLATLDKFSSIPSLLESALNPNHVSLSTNTQSLIQKFFLIDSCSYFLKSSTDITNCQELNKGILLRGFQSFLDDSKNYIELRTSYLYENADSPLPSQEVQGFALINDQFLREMRWGLIYTRAGFQTLEKNILNDVQTLSSNQESDNSITISIYIVLLMLFLLIIWRRQYNQLKNQIFKTNYYFTLLPFVLMKDNQHIRIYLQKHLNVKSLNVTI